MKTMRKVWILGLLAVLLLGGCGKPAPDSSDLDYSRLIVPAVDLTITDERGRTVYSRDFGVRCDAFRTEDIYLKLDGAQTVYHVTLQVGGKVYAFPVERVAGRATTLACTVGYPLKQLTGADNWRSATILPVQEGCVTVPVHGAGAYEVGSAAITIQEGKLTVTVTLDKSIDGSVDSAKVYVATTADQAARLDKKKFDGLTGKLDKAIPLGDAEIIAVYVQLSVTFDPNHAAPSPEVLLEGQEELWLQMMEPVG